jgi:hypothetical protein
MKRHQTSESSEGDDACSRPQHYLQVIRLQGYNCPCSFHSLVLVVKSLKATKTPILQPLQNQMNV